MDPPAGKRDREELQQDDNNESKRSKTGLGADPDPAKRAGDEVPSDEQRDAKRTKTDTAAASTDHGQPPPVSHEAGIEAVKHTEEPSAVDQDHDTEDHDMSDQHHERRHSHEGSEPRERVWHNDENTVFVKGLPMGTTEENLSQFFQPCGTIVGVRLGRNAEGQPKGFAYVEFATELAMLAAVRLNKRKLLGKMLFVAQSAPPKKGPKGGAGGAGPKGGAGAPRAQPSAAGRAPTKASGSQKPKQAAPAPNAPLRLLGMPRAVAVRTAAARKLAPTVQTPPTAQGGG